MRKKTVNNLPGVDEVLNKHPRAYIAGVLGSLRIWSSHSGGAKCLGTGKTAAEAWSNAAERLRIA